MQCFDDVAPVTYIKGNIMAHLSGFEGDLLRQLSNHQRVFE